MLIISYEVTRNLFIKGGTTFETHYLDPSNMEGKFLFQYSRIRFMPPTDRQLSLDTSERFEGHTEELMKNQLLGCYFVYRKLPSSGCNIKPKQISLILLHNIS
jgi:hypothetical protein